MTHNITGSEAFSPSPHILIRLSRRGAALGPVAWLFIGALLAGIGAAVIDTVTGQPFAMITGAAALGIWRIWPSRRG